MFGLGLYDFHARQMDQAVPRFMSIDPLAEDNYSISPYVYVDNNPIRWIDPDGMKKGDPDDPYELPEVVVVPSLPQKGDQVMDPTSNLLDYIFYRTYDYNANIIGKNYTISYLVNPNGIIINEGHILLTGTPPSVSTSNPLGTIKTSLLY